MKSEESADDEAQAAADEFNALGTEITVEYDPVTNEFTFTGPNGTFTNDRDLGLEQIDMAVEAEADEEAQDAANAYNALDFGNINATATYDPDTNTFTFYDRLSGETTTMDRETRMGVIGDIVNSPDPKPVIGPFQ